ncbi:MAG: hypothetical protein JO102_01220, partial [Elusimicrobia bacterium]|nr:hypothetical protein [Elusimicrobiota bacterium]
VAPEILAGPLANFKANVDAGLITGPKQLAAVRELLDLHQYQLFQGFDLPGTNDARKQEFLNQLVTLDSYYPGGLKAYRAKVQQLVAESKANVNPLEGKKLKAPKGEELTGPADARFKELENIGLKNANKVAYALPAGGKGERLGVKDGIKPAVPLDLATERPYMQEFVETIVSIQQKSNELNRENIPAALTIMASPDNRDQMVALVSEPAVNQGLRVVELTGDKFEHPTVLVAGNPAAGTIYVLSQGKVPSVKDVNGNFFTEPGDKYRLASDPHGHIDIHQLIHLSGLDERFATEGRQHLIFIQDTNGPLRNSVLAGLGSSVANDLAFNFMVFTRKPKENYGLITEIQNPDGSVDARANVEYVNADRLLQSEGGDVAAPGSTDSPFPGNPNQYIARLAEYRTAAEHLGGLPELIAYKKLVDGTRTRVEGNSQDVVYRFPVEKVGVTKVDPRYFIFSPAKNTVAVAAKNESDKKPGEGMQTAEAAYYQGQRLRLQAAGVQVNVDGTPVKFHGVTVPVGALVSFDGYFGVTTDEIASKIGGNVSVSNNAALVLRGSGIRLENANINGALVVNAAPGGEVTITGDIANKSWALVGLTDAELVDTGVPEFLRIRGYKLVKNETAEFNITEPGRYVIDGNGLRRIGDQPISVRATTIVTAALTAILGLAIYLTFGSPVGIDAAAGFASLILTVLAGSTALFSILGTVIGAASVDVQKGTVLSDIKNEPEFNQALVSRVEDFAAGIKNGDKPLKVEIVPGILARADKANNTFYIGSGLLKNGSFVGNIVRQALLYAVLRHELVHFSPLQLPSTNFVFRAINEVIAWVGGSLAIFLFGFVLFGVAINRGDQSNLSRGIDQATVNLGRSVASFADGLRTALFDTSNTRGPSTPAFIEIRADELNLGQPVAAGAAEGALSNDEVFRRLLVELD